MDYTILKEAVLTVTTIFFFIWCGLMALAIIGLPIAMIVDYKRNKTK